MATTLRKMRAAVDGWIVAAEGRPAAEAARLLRSKAEFVRGELQRLGQCAARSEAPEFARDVTAWDLSDLADRLEGEANRVERRREAA